jgi:hypothetical protein
VKGLRTWGYSALTVSLANTAEPLYLHLVARAEDTPDEAYHELVARAEREVATGPLARPDNVRDAVVRARRFKVLRQKGQDVVDVARRPSHCAKEYRVVALGNDLSVERGDDVLFS